MESGSLKSLERVQIAATGVNQNRSSDGCSGRVTLAHAIGDKEPSTTVPSQDGGSVSSCPREEALSREAVQGHVRQDGEAELDTP